MAERKWIMPDMSKLSDNLAARQKKKVDDLHDLLADIIEAVEVRHDLNPHDPLFPGVLKLLRGEPLDPRDFPEIAGLPAPSSNGSTPPSSSPEPLLPVFYNDGSTRVPNEVATMAQATRLGYSTKLDPTDPAKAAGWINHEPPPSSGPSAPSEVPIYKKDGTTDTTRRITVAQGRKRSDLEGVDDPTTGRTIAFKVRPRFPSRV